MENKKILIISINSINENTGGGIYLRTITNSYLNNNYKVHLICKKEKSTIEINDKYKQTHLTKNLISDLFSRLCLCPSFMFFYILKILFISRNYNLIAFHSSRLGLISGLLHILAPRKKIIFHFDNIESKLISQSPISFSPKGVITLIDKCIIPLSEYLAIKSSSNITFITKEDEFFFRKQTKNKKLSILPVCLPNPAVHKSNTNNSHKNTRIKLLFTGTFSFFPNIEALDTIITLAKSYPKYDFIIAGRDLKKLSLPENLSDNIFLYSDVSSEKLLHLYINSDIFISPIKSGSGMKTKLAEALSYGLPVISHEKSISGYSEAINRNVILTFNDKDLLSDKQKLDQYINQLIKLKPSDISLIFNEFYSMTCGAKVIANL